jgi:homoserine kinase type II
VTIPADLLDLLRPWGLGTVQSATRPATGTVHQTVLVTTARGRYALRSYRHHERAPVAREHAIIAHVRAHGLPVVSPLPLPNGGTILECDGRFHTLFPQAPGRQLPKHALGPNEARAMGACLGQLHRALADLPAMWWAQRTFAVERDATLAGIARLEVAIQARPTPDAADAAALAWLVGQRAWLLQRAAATCIDLTALEHQPIHGDYQESNLFFVRARVSAVIDWDQTYLAPRAWEVMRTLHLAFAFAPALCRPFLAAYRAVMPLPLADLDQAAAAYALKVGHDLWVFEEYYPRSNERVRRFLQPGGFASPATDWERLRLLLAG